MKPPLCDVKTIAEAVTRIMQPGQVVELRALDAVLRGERRPQTLSGYFNDPMKLAEAASSIESAKGIYYTPNPVNPALLARAANRIRPAGKEPTTGDADVIARCWLLVDCDPVRPAGISATVQEHRAARERALTICKDLRAAGWPWPILADSGNGAHLMYRIDLPADDGELVRSCLEALAARYDDPAVKIDCTVFNPARIWKLPGTLACKGDDTPERPHRPARIEKIPEPLEVAPRELLEALGAEADTPNRTATPATPKRGAINESPEALRGYLESHGATVKAVDGRNGGGHVLILDGCPMNGEHGKGTDSAVVLLPDGVIGFECKHNGCSSYKWADVREKIDPNSVRRAKTKPEAAGRASAPVLPFKPFPVDALPEALRGFVTELAAATGNDPACAALAALVVLGGVVGNRVAAQVKRGWIEPAILWGAIVAPSGTTKSAVLKLATRPLVELYKEARQQYAEDLAVYEADRQRYEAERDRWRTAQKKGAVASDPPVEPEAPTERRLLVSDVTCEKLGVLLQDNPLGLLLHRDELAAWVGAFDRYASGKGSDAPAWLSFFDATAVVIDRKSAAGTIFVERASVSVLGSIQPGTLRRVFGAAERESGLLARLLLVQPPSRAVVWTDKELSETKATDWASLVRVLMDIQPGLDEQRKPRPRLIPLAADAKPVYVGWHNAHGREVADIDSDDLAAHFAKLKGICIRLALVLACVDAATTGQAVAAIGREHIERAIAITDWFKGEARRVYAGLTESDKERDRRRLLELISRKGGSISGRELVQSNRAYPTVDDANAALEDLASNGYGSWQTPEQHGRGGPKSRRFVLAAAVNVYSNPADDSRTGNSVGVGSVDSSETEAADGREWGEL